MFSRLARTTVIALAALVAGAIIARALVGRLRPTVDRTPAWPPITPLPDQASPTPTASDEAPAPASPPADAERDDAPSASTWVEPDGGSCPTSHPIKGKLSSGIFHAPGGLNYDRTKPDRCYVDGPAAEADGLRPSKR